MSFLELDGDEARFNYGKYQGERVGKVREMDTQYLKWLISSGMSGRDGEILAKAVENLSMDMAPIIAQARGSN